MDLARELAVALEAARRAAAVVMRVYATEFTVSHKGANDPVTQADTQANALLASCLRAAFPDDAVCAEEFSLDESREAVARGGRCWFVDPLDGTREFVARNGEFCVMVGLAIDGDPRLGVVVAPAWNRTLWGIVGDGARERGVDGVDRALSLAPLPDDLRHARLLVSRSNRHPAVDRVADALGLSDVRACGSVGLKVALIAGGEADLYVHAGSGPKLWDLCAPEAIARAAGAVVTDAAGRAYRYAGDELRVDRGLVVAAAPLHARTVEAFSSLR